MAAGNRKRTAVVDSNIKVSTRSGFQQGPRADGSHPPTLVYVTACSHDHVKHWGSNEQTSDRKNIDGFCNNTLHCV